MTEKRLAVYLDGIPVGMLIQNNAGRVSFTYQETYRAADAIPLSLSMPIGRTSHPPKAVNAYLAGLLPDSEATLERWGRQFAVSPRNPFALLRHVGMDAAGAVQVLPEDVEPSDAATRQGDVEWLSENDVHQMTQDVAAHPADWNPGRDTGRWSLAGAQGKIALFRSADGRWGIPRDSTPTTHILKPSIPGFDRHHVNEHVCLRAARLIGLPAATSELMTHAGESEVLISHRYDRRLTAERWVRIHQEDLCQSLAVHPSMKYQSDGGPGIHEIAELLRRLPGGDRQATVRRFFDALVFNVSIGATDGHAKNYSMLLGARSRAQLGPLYDVATVLPYDRNTGHKSAMKVGETWEMAQVSKKDWSRAASQLAIPVDEALHRVEQIRGDIPDAFQRAAQDESIPDGARGRAALIADLVTAHVGGRRTAFGVLDPTPPSHG